MPRPIQPAAVATDRREPGQPAGPDRQDRPDPELPGPGRQREERPRLVGGGQPQGQRERGGGHDRRQHADPRRWSTEPTPPHAARGEQEQRRPEEVELLLDPERPEVEQRRRRELRLQVVGRLEREPQVGRVQRRGDPVLRHLAGPQRREDHGRGDHRGQDQQHRRRQQTTNPPGVEAGQRDRAGRVQLADQEAGDQEPGQHEEDVDADVAAGHARDTPRDRAGPARPRSRGGPRHRGGSRPSAPGRVTARHGQGRARPSTSAR